MAARKPAKQKNECAVKLGRLGGKATAAKRRKAKTRKTTSQRRTPRQRSMF